jgi:lysophospholipase L1-like esterase
MIVEGDSMPTTNEGNSQAWPDMLQTKANWAGKTSKGLISVSGAKFSDIVSQTAEFSAFLREPLAQKYYLFLQIGINDFNTSRTAAEVLADFVTYSTAVRAAAAATGETLILAYILPLQGTSGANTTRKNEFIAAVKAAPTTYVGANGVVVDLETIDSVFANGAGAYYSDGLHLNTTGQNAAAVGINGLITNP